MATSGEFTRGVAYVPPMVPATIPITTFRRSWIHELHSPRLHWLVRSLETRLGTIDSLILVVAQVC